MNFMKQWILGGDRSGSPATQVAELILRVFTGLAMALQHGWPKALKPEGIIGSTAEMGFPAPEFFGWAAIVGELVAGICLALGLGTRPAALLMLITMLVAAFIKHGSDPFGRQEKALLYAVLALYFLVKGAGKWSVDKNIAP